MKIAGLISIITGLISTFYGIIYNNSIKLQLYNGASNFVNDAYGKEVLSRDSKGTISIIIGIGLIILGIILMYIYENEEKSIVSNNTNNKGSDAKKNNETKKESIDGYKNIIAKLNKVYNLYKNKIYNEEDYSAKKSEWIEKLKKLKSVNQEDFLDNILPLIKEGALTSEDVDGIKYIISGKYIIDKKKQENERIEKLRKQEEAESEELKRKRKQAIKNKISKAKSLIVEIFNKIRNFMENNLSSTTRKIFIGGVSILIFIILFFIIGSTSSNPKRTVIAFENAANKNDTSKLSKILYSSNGRLKLTPDEIKPLLQAFKTKPSEFTKVISNLNDQVSNIKNGGKEDNTSNLYITKVGRTMLFFQKYKIAVKPVSLTITSSVKGADILVNDKQIAKVDSDNFSKKLELCVPGMYKVEGKADGSFGEMDNSVNIDFISDKKESETVNPLKAVYLQATSDYSNNEVYINDKDTGKAVNSGDKIGPIASGAKVYAVINYNGKKVKSLSSTISDTNSTINFDYSNDGGNSEDQKNAINNMITGYASSLADALTSGNTSQLVNYMYPGSKIYSEQMYNINTYYKGNNNFYEKYDSAVVNSCKMDPDGKSGTVNTTEVFDINEHNNEFGSSASTRTFDNAYKFKYNDTAKSYQLTERTSAVEK